MFRDILDFVRENDVKFIRLGFCDLFGTQKNVAIMANQLEHALKEGIPFDASAIHGFADPDRSDLFLVPLPDTINLLPWRPQQGRVGKFYCEIRNADMTPAAFDTRRLLSAAEKRLSAMGLQCRIGTECEFYLFKTDQDGEPTEIPHDDGGYLDISPLDRGENVRREICLNLEEMGISPESSHHEHGPGQNEMDFKADSPLRSADNFMTFKTVVKAISSRNGLFASFMPKPLAEKSGSGLHMNISIAKNGVNIFSEFSEKPGKVTPATAFIAGVLERSREISLFLNPLVNSYRRFGSFEAPDAVTWSSFDRSALLRVPHATDPAKRKMELRSPDLAINPYLAFALVLEAGLDGIDRKLALPDPRKAPPLPQNLREAAEIAASSEFVRRVAGDKITDRYSEIKLAEYGQYEQSGDRALFEREHYFKKI